MSFPRMDARHALHLAALLAWRHFPWPGGRGRYAVKRRLIERPCPGARPIPTEVGWLWLEWGEDVLQKTLYAGGEHYETEVTAYLRGLDLEGETVVDVGAHAGFYALLLARAVGPSGRLLAFEPQARLAAATERSLAHAGASWARVERVAAGERDGWLTLHLSPDAGRTTAGRLPDADGAREKVPMVRLDRRLEALDRTPALIKIDIEGAEWLALQGLDGLLRGPSPPRLVIEMHPPQIVDLGGSQAAIVRLLEDAGYTLHHLHHRTGLGPLERPLPRKTTWHLVAEPPGAPA